jgi:S1-C subfamily serine protease
MGKPLTKFTHNLSILHLVYIPFIRFSCWGFRVKASERQIENTHLIQGDDRMKRKVVMLMGIAAVLILALSAFSFVAAQDDNSQTSERPFLGVRIAEDEAGARVVTVQPGTPAAEAGLERNDIITAVNGEAVTAQSLAETIQQAAVGDTITLSVTRGDETLELEATLAAQSDLTPLRRPFEFNVENGVGISFDGGQWTISQLSEDHALYEAGLREGDVLTAINGEAFDMAVLAKTIQEQGADGSITLTVERDGESVDIEVPVNALGGVFGGFHFDFGGQGAPFSFGDIPGMVGGARLGVAFVMLDEQTAAEHDVDVTEGALITEVAENSPAADAGLQVGDIVTSVNGDVLDVERTLRDRLFAYEPGDQVTLDVLRDDQTTQIDVTLGQPEIRGMFPFDFMPFQFGPEMRGRGFDFFPFPFDGNPGGQNNVPEPETPANSL